MAEAGLSVVTAGNGVISGCPVSVCHQVSMIGHFWPPMCSWYHIHASGLMGSPTEPRSLRLLRSWAAGNSVPQRMKVRMAVGAVWKMVTPYFSTMRHRRSLSGQSGVPSYITWVTPLAMGP